MGENPDRSLFEKYSEWLNPVQRRDYRAVEIEGKTNAERARERDVTPATISTNVSNARERLRAVSEFHGEGVRST